MPHQPSSPTALERLTNCSDAVWSWFLWNDLQLNADKLEAVILGTTPHLQLAATIQAFEVASSRLQVPPKLKSFGVTISSHLPFDCHAKDVARARNYQASALRHVRSLLFDSLDQTVACSIVTSMLDYFNAMLYGAPATTFDILQRARNNLARVVCHHGGRTNARQLLRSLHWLPVKQRATYKMLM